MNKVRLILLFVIFLYVNNSLQASHVSGGHINYKSIGQNKYFITVSIIRDCSGSQYSSSTAVINSTCGTLPSKIDTLRVVPFVAPIPTLFGGPYSAVHFPYNSILFNIEEISDVCDNVLDPKNYTTTRCRNTSKPAEGYTRFKFSGIVTLSPCTNWKLSFQSLCCRNKSSSITPTAYFESKLNNKDFPKNSSPIIESGNRQRFGVCVGKFGQLHLGVNDPDGDSLTYDLTCAKGVKDTCITYNLGHSATSPIGGVNLEKFTGRFRFKPVRTGVKVIAYIINEYDRCTGKWKASTMRDFQLRVNTCTNNNPHYTYGISQLKGVSVNKIDSFSLSVKEGSAFSFEDTIYDPNTSDTVVVFSNFITTHPRATLQVNQIAKNKCHIKFSWTPPAGKTGDIILPIEYNDNYCSYPGKTQVVYKIKVNPELFIFKKDSTREDTILVMKGDTLDLWTSSFGRVNWNSAVSNKLIWGGTRQNFWADTTALDTNKTIRYLATTNTRLKATGFTHAQCNQVRNGADSVYIKLIPTFNVDRNLDTVVCKGTDSIQLNVHPDSNYTYTYLWTTDKGKISNPKVKNPWVQAIKGAQYWVKLTSNYGGERTKLTKIKLIDNVSSSQIFASSDTICKGASRELAVTTKYPTDSCALLAKRNIHNWTATNSPLQLFSGSIGNRLPNPFTNKNLSTQQQYLYTDSLLKAEGLKKGLIQGLSFYVDSSSIIANSTLQFNNFSLKIACTRQKSHTYTITSGLIDVKKASTIFIKAGWNKIDFDSALYWNGKMNLIVQICFQNLQTISSNVHTAVVPTNYKASLGFLASSGACGSRFLSWVSQYHVPVLQFDNVPYTDTSLYKYSWSPQKSLSNNNHSKTIASPVKKTTYKVIISDSINACPNDTISKTLYVIDPIVIAGQDSAYCPQSFLTMNPTVTPNFSGKYSWGPKKVFSNDSIKQGTLIVLGNETVWLEYTNAYGCVRRDSIDISIIKLANPNFVSGSPFCEIQSNNLLVPIIKGGKFSGIGVDSSTNNFDATNPLVKPSLHVPKTVPITYTISNKGCVSDTTILVQVYPQFDTTYIGKRTFCESDSSEKLFTKHSGGLWTGNGVTNSVFTARLAAKGLHTIRVDSTGFCGNSASYSFEVFENPDHDFPDTVYGCDNKPALLDAGNVGATYLWNTGAASQTITATKNGKYWVRIINGNLCEITDTTQVKITEICIGIETSLKNSNQIKVFPNPASRYLNIEIDRGEIKKVKLLSLSGQMVGMYAVNANKSMIDLLDISNGTYIIQVESNVSLESFVIVIEK